MPRTNRRPKTLVSALLLLNAQLAIAQGTEEAELALAYGDKSFVSVATGSRQPIARAPSTATVITAEEIEAMGAADLDEVLEMVPGLHVSHNAAYGNKPIYIIRGIYHEQNPQVLMLINGVPMTSVYLGDRGDTWGGMPVENIARIEVIRGPGSALYGADAYSGVINIITKNAAHVDATQIGARYGSFDTREGWVQHGGKWGPFDAALFFQAGKTDGAQRDRRCRSTDRPRSPARHQRLSSAGPGQYATR